MAETKTVGKLAIVLIRGREIGLRHDMVRALDSLGLLRKHACAILEDTPENRAIAHKVKDLTTYGPISEETLKALEPRIAPSSKDRTIKVYRLAPPRGGFKKGIKTQYQQGGSLGLRRKGMDEFIARMM